MAHVMVPCAASDKFPRGRGRLRVVSKSTHRLARRVAILISSRQGYVQLRYVAIMWTAVLVGACSTPGRDTPGFDLFSPLLGTWVGPSGTLEFTRERQFVMRGAATTTGQWDPIDLAHFDLVSPEPQRCAVALSGDRLAISSCRLAGEYLRARRRGELIGRVVLDWRNRCKYLRVVWVVLVLSERGLQGLQLSS